MGFMLLFFRKDFNFKTIESDRFHKIRCAKDGMGKLIEFADMILKHHGTRKIQRLTKLVQDRHPSL